jgi:hypothetical protein
MFSEMVVGLTECWSHARFDARSWICKWIWGLRNKNSESIVMSTLLQRRFAWIWIAFGSYVNMEINLVGTKEKCKLLQRQRWLCPTDPPHGALLSKSAVNKFRCFIRNKSRLFRALPASHWNVLHVIVFVVYVQPKQLFFFIGFACSATALKVVASFKISRSRWASWNRRVTKRGPFFYKSIVFHGSSIYHQCLFKTFANIKRHGIKRFAIWTRPQLTLPIFPPRGDGHPATLTSQTCFVIFDCT